MSFFKVKKPKSPQEQFGGRTITAYRTWADARARTNPDRIRVDHICGNLTHQTAFQINGSHLVSMLDAFCELEREELPPKDVHEAFCDTVAEGVEVAKKKTEEDEIREFTAEDISGE